MDETKTKKISWIDPMQIDIVLYHASCPDGTGAAWPFWREHSVKLQSCPFQAYEVRHGEPYPDVTDKSVAIVDFSFKRSIMKDICRVARYVRVIDHHKTAIRDLEGLEAEVDNYIGFFDIERSGAQLVWDLIYPGISRPWFIDIIADRDLWKWEIPDSKYIGKALYHRDWYTFQKMEYIMELPPDTTKALKCELTKEGRFISAREKRDIDYACGTAILCEFEGYKVKLTSCHPTLRSEVGNILSSNGCDFAATWRYDFLSDSWWMSLRGSNKSSLDLAKICEKFGGGGHPKACGFTIHGTGSKIWQNANEEQRKNLAFGERGLHSYFMIHNN